MCPEDLSVCVQKTICAFFKNKDPEGRISETKEENEQIATS